MEHHARDTQILIYQAADGTPGIDVRFQGETAWLTQAQVVELFQSSKANISEHIKHIFEEGELERDAVVRKFRTTQKEGDRVVSRDIAHYNLDLDGALHTKKHKPLCILNYEPCASEAEAVQRKHTSVQHRFCTMMRQACAYGETRPIGSNMNSRGWQPTENKRTVTTLWVEYEYRGLQPPKSIVRPLRGRLLEDTVPWVGTHGYSHSTPVGSVLVVDCTEETWFRVQAGTRRKYLIHSVVQNAQRLVQRCFGQQRREQYFQSGSGRESLKQKIKEVNHD